MRRKILLQISSTIAIVLLLTLPAYCCTPMIPMGFALGGANWIMASVFGLILAVSVKVISFPFFTRNLGGLQAGVFMLIANIATSFLGLFIVGILMTPIFAILLFIPLIAVVSIVVGKRIKLSELKPLNKMPTGAMAVILIALYFGSAVLCLIAQGIGHNSPGYYWLVKVLCIYGGLLMGFILTACYEEWIIALLGGSRNDSYLTPVIKSNLIALFVVSVIGAIIMLPHRLNSTDFIVNLINLFR